MNYFKEDKYWEKHINDKLEDDLWILEYMDYLPKDGKLLDLGCGIGNYTKYFMACGYDVISSDISKIALNKVKEFNPNVVHLDMSEHLPFENNTFDIVFASLSIHYFDDKTTTSLISEIKRILKKEGIFIGSVNSIKAYDFIKDHIKEISHHYYLSNDKYIRLFDIEDINKYLKDFCVLLVREEETIRFNKKKDYLIFIGKK